MMMRLAMAWLLLGGGLLGWPGATLAQNTVAIELKLSWREIGAVELDGAQRLAFPDVAAVPGLYRFELRGQPPSVYIGETKNLRARFAQYRMPGKSQATNMRMCA